MRRGSKQPLQSAVTMVHLFMIEHVPCADTLVSQVKRPFRGIPSQTFQCLCSLRFTSRWVQEGGWKVEQCDLESEREFATACSQLLRYELNMRNVNLSMCGHGAIL